MIAYLDTSLIIASLLPEAKSEAAYLLLARHADDLAISAWVATEVSAALSIKCRTGQIPSSGRQYSVALFRSLAETAFATLDVSAADFQVAATLADSHEAGLRAGDALHCAIVLRHGAMLQTLDKKLSDSATRLGVPSALL